MDETTRGYADACLVEIDRLEDQAERLWRQRIAYRRVAIEWFNPDGPAPENFSDEDVVASVDALAEEDRRTERSDEGDQADEAYEQENDDESKIA